jgi:hypothetical protein
MILLLQLMWTSGKSFSPLCQPEATLYLATRSAYIRVMAGPLQIVLNLGTCLQAIRSTDTNINAQPRLLTKLVQLLGRVLTMERLNFTG